MSEFEFDQDFEEDVLAYCLVNDDYLQNAVKLMEAHFFISEAHGWIWSIIQDTWVKFSELASSKVLSAAAKRDFPDSDKRIPVLQLASRLLKLKPTAPKASLDQLHQFIRMVTLQDTLEKSAKALERGKIDEAWDSVKSATRIDLRPKAYQICDWIEEFEDRQDERKFRAENPDKFTCVPTGWPTLDRVAMGVSGGEMALLLATTNKGKSICATNFGYNGVVRGFKTVHVTTEMKVPAVAQRYDSRFTGQPYIDFKKWDFTTSQLKEIKLKLERKRASLKGMLKIIHLPVGANTSDLLMAMQEARDGMGGLDLLVLDSPDHLQPQTKHRDHRLNQAQVFWELKKILDEEDVAGWATVQAGKEWEGKMAKSEATSESYDKARIADMIVSLNLPEKSSRASVLSDDDDENEYEDNRHESTPDLIAFLAKYRDGKARIPIPLRANFEIMHIEEIESS
jgi:replicative DNA helicase